MRSAVFDSSDTREVLGDRLRTAWLKMTQLVPGPPLEAVDARSAGLRHAVRIVTDGLLGAPAQESRQVPSAGAIYPYDVLALIHTDEPTLFWMDLLRRICVRLDAPAAALAGLMEPARLADGGPAEAQIILLGRPWLSMRKYGSRGYFYTQLDTGHAATSLLGTALEDGPAVLRLRTPRADIRACLEPWLPHREVHSVLTIGAPRTLGEGPEWATFRLVGDGGLSHADGLESLCWSDLPEILYDSTLPLAEPSLIHTAAPLADAVGAQSKGAGRGINIRRWREVARRRRSCKRFSGAVPDTAALLDALAALGTALPTDLADTGPDVRLTLLTHDAETAKQCSDTLRDSRIRVIVPDGFRDAGLLRRSCIGQDNAERAAVFALFHTPAGQLLDGGPQAVHDALFRASSSAHLLYLGAARSSVAVTTFGGYDSAQWRRFAGLDDTEEVLYLLAFGIDQGSAVKLDRAHVAYAHGE